jgi:hypothetical protein
MVRKIFSLCGALVAVSCLSSLATAESRPKALSDAAIAAAIVQDSRSAYYATGHPCACPDDHMRNGRLCGGTSAYIRPGGAHPLCSATDVSPEMISRYRATH